jgi:hypothetical protein
VLVSVTSRLRVDQARTRTPDRGRSGIHQPVAVDQTPRVTGELSPARSGKSTGNLLNVDGGVTAAYPR